ncbi:MAG: acetyltransferase [Firmicutes bacterium]|nr:acetyltransferase [Bacillota bacterium]
MIRKAAKEDLAKIMEIIKATVEEMKTYGNTQWDESYPQEKDFNRDINSGDLYVDERDGEVAGFICVNQVEPVEYEELDWSSKEKAMVVHRMAVNPKFRRKGIASGMMKFADELANSRGIRCMKTDTYSVNPKMNALFVKCGYKFVGEMSFLGKEKPFNSYEKFLIK